MCSSDVQRLEIRIKNKSINKKTKQQQKNNRRLRAAYGRTAGQRFLICEIYAAQFASTKHIIMELFYL